MKPIFGAELLLIAFHNGRFLFEHEIDSCHKAKECCHVVPRKVLAFKENGDNYGEDDKRDYFLNNLELDEAERPAIVEQAHSVGWHLTHIFKEGYAPREEDDHDERPMGTHTVLLKFQMAVPGKRHKDV